MNYKLPLTALLSIASIAANASIIAQWTFDDVNGTTLSAAASSVSGLFFNSSTTNPGNWTTNGSGQLTGGLGTIGNAVFSNVSSGTLQLDMTGVTFTALTGGTDDWVTIGLRSFGSSNITGFGGAGSSGSNQALMVIGNENGSSGLDIEVIDNGVSTLVTDLTTDFTGTFDFRIILDLDNDTADYLYQVNGGGYSTVISQQANSATINTIALGGGTFSDTISIDTVTIVPEPSTYALLAGMLTLGLVLVRRRQR